MNLSDFSNKSIDELRGKNKALDDAKKKAENLKQNDPEKLKSVEDAYNHYSKLSQPELMQELLKQTNQQKADGTLDNSQIDNVYNSIAPMLNNEQKKNLDNLINIIKQ